MVKINYRRIFILAGLVSLALIYTILWMRMITTQEQRVGADFIAFYSVGRIAQSDGFTAIYNTAKEQAIQAQVVGFSFDEDQTAYFNHPPFLVPLIMLITSADYVTSLIRWTVILLVLNAICAFLLVRTLPPGAFRKSELWAIGLGTFLFFPTFSGLMNGQDTLLLLLGSALLLHEMLNQRDLRAGLGLSLITIRPHIALLLALPFLFKRQKIWWWFAGAAAVLVIFSILLIGIKGTENYLGILTISASDEGHKINEFAMVNFIGLLRRLAPDMSSQSARLVGWIVYACAFILLCIVWVRSKNISPRQIGLAVLVAILAVPHLHYHDLALLLIPIFCLMRICAQRNLVSSANLAMMPVALSLLMLPGFLGAGGLKYPLTYLVMALLGFFLLFPQKIPGIIIRSTRIKRG